MASRYPMTITALCAVILLLVMTSCAQQHNASGADESSKRRDPQLYFDVGPFKMSISYKESKSNDKMKLGKSTMNYYLTTEDNPFYWNLFKVTHREDMLRCGTFLDDMPEVESLIDCKPLDVGDRAAKPAKYVKRTIISAKAKLDLFGPAIGTKLEQKHDYHLYPLEADFADQTIKRILKENDLPQGLGFGPYTTTSGHFLVIHPTETVRCTGNFFVSVNLTEPIPERAPSDDYPEFFHTREHLMLMFKQNGGFVSFQDISCGIPGARISLDTDFTLIHRKQFPYLTCSHRMATSPYDVFWNYTGTIKQTRDSMMHEAYNTSVQVDSRSGLVSGLNFKVDQNFTNEDFSTGSEQMFLIHPMLTAWVRGNWTQDSLAKSMVLFFKHSFETLIPKTITQTGLMEPKVMFMYKDNPEESHVALTITMDRKLFNNYKSSLEETIDESFIATASPERSGAERNADTLFIVRNEL